MGEVYLAHHGIKGMQWGVRRTPEQLGHKDKKEKRKNTSSDHDTATSKKAKQMSTEELKKSLERMRMEDEYNRLTASTAKKGRQKAGQVLADSGSIFLKAAVGAGAAFVAKKFVTDFLANKGLEKAVAIGALTATLAFAPLK